MGNSEDYLNDPFLESIDDIVNSAKEEGKSEKDGGASGGDEAETGFLEMDPLEALVNEISSTEGEEEESLVDSNQDLMALLRSEEGLSDIGDLLDAGEEDETFNDTVFQNYAELEMGDPGTERETAAEAPGEGLSGEDASGEEDASGKSEEKAKKPGFFARLKKLLFGEEDEEESEQKTEKDSDAQGMEEISDDGFAIFRASDQEEEIGAEAAPSPEEEAARKKEEKKAAKAKKKEERQKKKQEKKQEKKDQKAKKQKQAKPKKVKAPKEKDNTPPLPKVPVFLVFAMAASFFALIIIATNLLGYSNSFAQAEDAYSRGDYELAYQQVAGMEVKEADLEEYEKYKIAATISGEYRAYESLMQGGIYDMALDSLVRTLGRCEKYYPDAEAYGCAGVVDSLKAEAVNALSIFGMNEEAAMALYHTEERGEYSRQIYDILKAAGLEKAEEE